MAVPGQEEAQPTELIVRFTLAVEAFPHGELFSVNSARGPPDMTVSLQAAIFRSDDSSLKRNLSAVVRQALSSLGESPFGRGNPVAYASAKRAVSESKTPTPTWLEKNVPRLKNVSLFSRSMESIFNRTLAERLQANFGFDLLRFLSQTNFTGGLGHVTYDYHESLGQDGADVASVFPLWDWIKGVVKHTEKRSLVDGYPPLPHRADGSPYESLGDMLRDSMEKREDLSLGSYRIPENAAFWDWVRREAANPSSPLQQESRKALLLRGKEIQFDVYALQAKYSGQPIFYLDAYVKEGEKKIRVFDQLYGDPPNAPWRAVQVLVYSQANQQLIAELVRQGYAQQDVVTLDHEVFAQFPDLYLTWQGIRGLIRHGIHAFNHTVFRPGLWNLPKPVAGLLGLDQRGDLDDWGAVSIARAANERAGAVTGVSRIHWLVLLKKLFRMESHKVVNRFDPAHPDQGMSSANGVLLEHWQGIEIRRLIDQTKESLRLSASMDDQMFYETLEQNKYRDELNNYKQRFEMIKAMYTLDLLLFLNDTQTQPQGGGGHWLAESLSEVEGQTKGQYTLENIRGFRDRWQFLINRSFADETAWGGINQEFSELKEALLKRPVVSNVRRQVSYKGPDMYRDILQSNKEAFRQSGVRLIFGGRTFDGGGRGTFDHAKQLAQDVGAVAFLENYNSEDAPIIYRGATAGVMLANEFVEAAATSNSKIVVNGGWLISVFDGASPERTAVMDKATGNIKFAISYTHDVLRAGLAQGTLEILNGSLIFFDDNSLSETDGKGAGRRPSQASLLDCFASLGQAYESPHHRQEMLYRAIRWSYTADIHRQTQAFLDIENAVVQFQADVAAVAKRIAAASPAGGLSLEDQTETLLYKKASDGFVWKHRHNVSNPALLEGVGHGAGWVGFLAGFRTVKSRYYDQGRGSAQGDEEGLGLWSVQHHVKDENGDNELIQYVSGLLEGLPAFQPLLDQLREFQSDKTLGTDSSSLDVRVNQTLKALEFVQRTVDRVRESLIKSDLDSGADSVRGILLPLEKNTREALFQQNYTYQWRISVAPQTPDHDFNYMESGKELKDLRDALRLLLNEDSQGTEAIKQASYGSPDGAYFFPFVATRWKSTPALRNFALALGDEVERIKIEGGVNGWSDPSTQWRIRRVYAKFLGALDEMIEPTLPSETPAVVPKKQKSFEETVSEEAPKALRYDSLGSLNRLLLGGPAQPIVFGSLTADVERVREFVEQDRVQVKAAQNSLSQILGGWELRGPDGNLSESLVLQAGQSLGRAVRQRDEAAASAPVSAAQQVFMALVSFGDSLKGASIEDWNRWVALFARGFNGNLSDVQESVLGSIKSGRRLGIVLTETLMDGTLTEEDKTRLEELTILAAHPDQFEGGRLTWILPKGMKNLDSLWSIYPQLSPLKGLSSVALSKEDLVGSDGKYSIKKFLMKSQNQTRLENLNPADLYLDNRDEWVLENDIPNGLARLLISLAGGLVYDATERVGEELKQLYYLRTNA
jgi:hypothetical protein